MSLVRIIIIFEEVCCKVWDMPINKGEKEYNCSEKKSGALKGSIYIAVKSRCRGETVATKTGC